LVIELDTDGVDGVAKVLLLQEAAAGGKEENITPAGNRSKPAEPLLDLVLTPGHDRFGCHVFLEGADFKTYLACL
jgi:hypothetical protein